MAVILESKTQSEAELTEALEVNGLKVDKPEDKVEETKPVVEEKKPSEQSGEPGDKVPAETEGEAAAEAEAAEGKSQEKPQVEEKQPKAKGGYQSKIEKQTRVIDQLQAQIEAKDGNESRLRRELEAAQSKLAELQPAEAAKPDQLVRPKRPKLGDKGIEFDQEALDTALDKYDDELEKYHVAVADKTANDKVAAYEEKRKEDSRKEAVAKSERDYQDRLQKGVKAAGYDDFDELAAALPPDAQTLVDRSRVVADYIATKSKDPIHLVRFLMKDFLEGDEAEANRFMEMDAYDQAYAIKELEERLIRENGKGAKSVKAAAPEPKDDAEPEVKPPVKAKPRVEAPDAPIKPVGSSSQSKGKSLDEQMREAADSGDSKKFQELLAQQHKEKQAARA